METLTSNRELLRTAYEVGKIDAWWRSDTGFCVLLRDGSVGRIATSRVEAALEALPAKGTRQRASKGKQFPTRYVDL